MAINADQPWEPKWAVPPGDILREVLDDRMMTQMDLARRMNRPAKTVNEIIQGKASLTAETAIQLERSLGISARFWNALESNYAQARAREISREALEAESTWLDRFPIGQLVQHGVLERGKTKVETLEHLLEFFRVSSKAGWENTWGAPTVALRQSTTFTPSPEAVSVWLRWGEVQAEHANIRTSFNLIGLRRSLDKIRELTVDPIINSAVAQAQDILADVGIALILTPELKETYISGALRRPTVDRVIVQLSLRHKSDDQFWFSMFHELGHLISSRKPVEFVDLDDDSGEFDEQEEIANSFARDLLVPSEQFESFVDIGDFDQVSVRRFSANIGVSPGIVVGRLQREGFVNHATLNGLKRSLRWPRPSSRITDSSSRSM